jgi:hypothetical protein
VRKRTYLRRASLLASLAVVAGAMLITSGSAANTTKPYTANLCILGQLIGPACPEGVSPTPTLPGGSSDVYLTIRNHANPQALGSANLGLPTGPSLSYTGAQITQGGGDATVASTSLVTLRNLNLPPEGLLTVKLTVQTPACSGGTYHWDAPGVIQVKQSNNFNGPPGNDFTRVPTSSLTATLAGAGGCHLAIVPDNPAVKDHQPKDTAPNQPITDGFLSSGNAIQVGLYDSSHNLVTFTGSCPAGPGCVTVDRTGGDPTSALSGTKQQALVGGIATFGGLTLDNSSVNLYALTFSSDPAITGATSDGFAIVVDDCTVTDGSCSVDGVFPKNGNTPTTTADATATFAGAGSLSLRFFLQGAPPAGCENFTGTGSAGVDAHVQGSTTGMFVTLGLSDKALKQAYGTNYGQPDVPICVGAQRLVNGQTIPCQNDPAGGWTGKVLDPVTHKPNGLFDSAVCNADGLWWNIAPTFQDNPNPPSPPNPPNLAPISIVISSWGSATAPDGTALRTFTIFKPPGWDSRGMG